MIEHLNFGWDFIASFDESFLTKKPTNTTRIDLPHNMVAPPFNYFSDKLSQIKGTYFKTFTLEEKEESKTYILSFAGVNNAFSLYVNDLHIGNFAFPYLDVECIITDALRSGENNIVVVVDGSERVNTPPFGFTIDYYPFSGIYREVMLKSVPRLYIERVFIDARANGEVMINTFIPHKELAAYRLFYTIKDSSGQIIYAGNNPTFSTENITPWSLETPILYTLQVTLTSIYGEQIFSQSFGYRDIEFTTKGFFLNNQKIKLVGLNRHETFPYLGGAATKHLQIEDVNVLKKLGVNYVRSSHYPQSPHFLQACDEKGLLVINEVPGWQHIGDENWQAKHLLNVEKMIKRDYNHPCVISWSIRINESVDHDDLYEKSQRLAKSLDLYRPTTGTRNFAHSRLFEDIYSYNDFIHRGTNRALVKKQKVTKSNKPYIVSENNGHMFPTKVFDAPLVLESHTKRHLAVLDATFGDEQIVGMSSWCMHDYYTHHEFGSGDHICYHGVLDMYRFYKPAAFAYMANLSTSFVLYPLFSGNQGDLPESKLYETLVLSNAHHLKLFKGSEEIATFYPRFDLYPHLPHPPFLLNKFISDNLETTINFSPRHKKVVANLLNYAAIHNFDQLPLSKLLRLGSLMVRYKLSRGDLVELWSRNVVSWGAKFDGFTLRGYDASNEELGSATIGPTKEHHYDISLSKDTLVNDTTYDTIIVNIISLNNIRQRNTYDFTPVNVTLEGPLRLTSPNYLSLHGGALSIYIHSQAGSGNGKITITIGELVHQLAIKILTKGGNN